MEELYSIMRDFLELEYNQESLLYVLKALEVISSGEQKEEAKLIANHAKGCIKALQEELRAAISKMDTYIAATAGHK